MNKKGKPIDEVIKEMIDYLIKSNQDKSHSEETIKKIEEAFKNSIKNLRNSS